MLKAPEPTQLNPQPQQQPNQHSKAANNVSSMSRLQQAAQNPLDLSPHPVSWSELRDQLLPPIHSSQGQHNPNPMPSLPQWQPSQPLKIPIPANVQQIQQQNRIQQPGQQSTSTAIWSGPSQLYGGMFSSQPSQPKVPLHHPLTQKVVLPSLAPGTLTPVYQTIMHNDVQNMNQTLLQQSNLMGPPITPPRPQNSSSNNNTAISNNNSADGITFSPTLPPLSSISSTGSSPLHARRDSDAMSLEDGREGGYQQQVETRRYTLSDFQILSTLGTGSFGRVHLVLDATTKQYKALKVMKKVEVVRLKQVEHTVNEKTILEQLRHPFLVQLDGVFQDNQNLYLVLEYVQGGELFTYLRKSGRFPTAVARFYAAQVVLAFEFLHDRDIVYRDLKPENLLIDSKGCIKITDFGFAKYVPDVTWTLCGTPDYLAPEIIQAKGYGKAVDWWALGVLLYEMIAGHPPFYDEDHFKLYEKILAGKLRFPTHFDPDAKDLVRKLLVADLTRRFGNLREGASDIKAHKFFHGVDWKALVEGRIPPPFIPKSTGPSDTSNFDAYPEDYEPYGTSSVLDPYRNRFSTFGPY